MINLYASELVYLKIGSGKTGSGVPIWGTAFTARGRVTIATKMILTATGRTVPSTAVVLLPPNTSVGDEMQLSLDGGTKYRNVIEIKKPRDMAGRITHYEVIV